jgi:putative ABC transport system ATP-binding protein
VTSVVELDQVERTHPGAPPVTALRGVSLSLAPGELVGVVGPSGSGKSTLLNVLGTLDRPTSGSVRIGGTEVSRLSDAELSRVRARQLGFVFQQFLLIQQQTALENVVLGLVYRGVARGERVRMASEALERVGLADRADHRPSQLSGGEQQRVAIARAVAGHPKLVLADEPTGNLDSASSAEVIALLRELHRQGTTVVIVTHDLDLAAALPRRITLRDGELAT